MILQNLDEFVACVPTASSLIDEDRPTAGYDKLRAYLFSAELWIQSNVLGKNLYDSINGMAESSGAQDEDLLHLCRCIISNHAFWDAVPFLDLQLTPGGFGVIGSNNLVPASKERVERLREQCLIRRDAAVEDVIEYLEDHETYHDDWKGSKTFSLLNDCLIRTAKELENYASWTGTRRDFLKLQPKMIQLTSSHLMPVFSRDYIEELIEKQNDDDLETDDMIIVTGLKRCLGSLLSEQPSDVRIIQGDLLYYIDHHLESFETYVESKEYKARQSALYENVIEDPTFMSVF